MERCSFTSVRGIEVKLAVHVWLDTELVTRLLTVKLCCRGADTHEALALEFVYLQQHPHLRHLSLSQTLCACTTRPSAEQH